MRLFLDVHVSGRRIAAALRQAGHDVRAADEERSLDGWSDRDLLALATDENRIMVTCNVRDFPRIVQSVAAENAHHAGCIILVGIDHSEFGTIVRVLTSALSARLAQDAWQDYTAFVSGHA